MGVRDEEKLYKQLCILREHLITHEARQLMVAVNGSKREEHCRKIMEYVFRKLEIKVTLAGQEVDRIPEKVAKVPSERIVVRSEGKSYAELLKQIKSSVNVDDLGIKINNIKRIGKEDVMFVVDGQKREANILKEEIKRKTNIALDVKVHNKDILLHVNDIDATMGANDILEEMGRKLGLSSKANIEVKSLRLNSNGGQVAMVAVQDRNLAERLLLAGKIKIGWVNCRVRKWIRLVRCFKCQQFGHYTGDCKQEERGDICRRCGGDSHKEKECTEKAFCITCNVEGHRNNQSRCPVFRELMAQKLAEGKKTGKRPRAQRRQDS